MKICTLAILLSGLIAAQKVFIEVDGDAFVMPTDRITADLLLNSPKFEGVLETDLPAKFWERQKRTDLAKLSSHFGISETLKQMEKVLPDGKGHSQFFAADGDFLLVMDVKPTPNGPKFITAFSQSFDPDNFKFRETNLDLLKHQSQNSVGKLRAGPVLTNLDQSDLFHLTRFYFPHMESFTDGQKSEHLVQMIRQSIRNLLVQLERNEKDAPHGDLRQERDILVTMIFHNAGKLSKYIHDWQIIAGPSSDGSPLISWLAGKVTKYTFEEKMKSGLGSDAVSYLLNSRWQDYTAMANILKEAIDEYGLDIMGPMEWHLLQAMPVLEPFETILISGIVLGTINADGLLIKSHLDRLVRKQAYQSLWIGQSHEALKAVARPFSWIASNYPAVMLPTRVLKLLVSDTEASILARECLLKHMILDGDRETLLPWFFNLYGTGKAQFRVNAELRQKLIEADAELGFLAFPNSFDNRPPVSFSKATLLELVASGPVDGTQRSINMAMVRLIEMRMHAMSLDELYTVMEWARKSHLSYVIGIFLLDFWNIVTL